MDAIVHLSPDFAVTAALRPDDFAEAARLGFKSILSNRRDGEDDGQLDASAEAALCSRNGLQFRHLPAPMHELFSDHVVTGVELALEGLERPVLAHCKSGQRSAIVWAAARARTLGPDAVLAILRDAGFNLAALRDEFEAQATFGAERAKGSPDDPGPAMATAVG